MYSYKYKAIYSPDLIGSGGYSFGVEIFEIGLDGFINQHIENRYFATRKEALLHVEQFNQVQGVQ